MSGEPFEPQRAHGPAMTLQDDVVHAHSRRGSRAEGALEMPRQRPEDVLPGADSANAHRRIRGGALDDGAVQGAQLQGGYGLVPQVAVEDGRGGMNQGHGGAVRALVGEEADDERTGGPRAPAEQIDGDVEDAVPGHVAIADPHDHRQHPRHGDQAISTIEGAHDARRALRGPRGLRGRRRDHAVPRMPRSPALNGDVLPSILLIHDPECEPTRRYCRRRRHDHRRSPRSTPPATVPEP